MVKAQCWSEVAKNIQVHPFPVPVLGGLGQEGLQGQCGLHGTESEGRVGGTGPSLWDLSSSFLVHRKCLFIPTKPLTGTSLSQSTWPRSVKTSLASKAQLWSGAFPCRSISVVRKGTAAPGLSVAGLA